ncbi:MAG: hypothetical protein MJ152_03280, partial [Clostridia bacterium]|nr:hypothetical protein [Clostridia bacterium]
YLDANESEEDSLGLFAYIENAYIKNINLQYYDAAFSSKNTLYSGGLAGKITDTVIVNVNFDGANTVINAYSFAGGVAGIIEGKSTLYGITSNLKAQTTVENSALMYYNKNNYTGTIDYDAYIRQLSYAGGVAGVLDLSAQTASEYNVSYVTINGSAANSTPKVSASYAGGVAGYASENVSALKVKYNVGAGDRIKGYASAGGLFGVFLGNLKASQVTAEEDTQYNYDVEIANYILELVTNEDAQLDKTKIGNTTLIESAYYAGGLVGVGTGCTIDCCYSKASFYSGKTIGGLVGTSLNTYITQAYAVPYLNTTTCADALTLPENENYYFGGIYGKVLEVNSLTDKENEMIFGQLYNRAFGGKSSTNNIEFAYSTIILDNIIKTETTNNKFKVGYLFANKSTAGNDYSPIARGGELHFVFVGTVNVDAENKIYSTIEDENYGKVIKTSLSELYNLEDAARQEALFNRMFSGWTTDYWSLNRFKYFPLLTSEEFGDYILIETANDFNKVLTNPTGSFMIKPKTGNSIDMSSWCNSLESNYVLNISGGFKGTLIGYSEDESSTDESKTPKLTGLHIDAINGTDGAGFFNKTVGATIKNIEFVWNDVNTNSAINVPTGAERNPDGYLEKVGLVSAVDDGSLFSALVIRARTNNNKDVLGNFL